VKSKGLAFRLFADRINKFGGMLLALDLKQNFHDLKKECDGQCRRTPVTDTR
jgi:hypothetical protein